MKAFHRYSALVILPLLFCLLPPPRAAVSAVRPNILLIVSDDQGWPDLGCIGKKQIKTPHLDRLAAEGVRLTNFITYPGRYVAVDLVNPDYVKLADAYGIQGIRAESPEALSEALVAAKSSEMPVIIDVPINLESY